MVGGSVTLLGNGTLEELQEAWQEIKAEYFDIVHTPKSITIFHVWNKLQSTDIKYKNVKLCLWALKQQYDAEIAEELMKLGYDLVEDLPDRDAYLKQIYFIETEVKTLVVLMNQYHNEYQLLCPPGEVQKSRTVQDYDEELQILSKYQGYKIKKREETVSDIAGIINNYLKENGATV